jgi:hypothetical protein
MNQFEHKSLEWLGDQYMKIDNRIADRTRKSKRKLIRDNMPDEKLLYEITTQLNVIQKDDMRSFLDWAIKNQTRFSKEVTDG